MSTARSSSSTATGPSLQRPRRLTSIPMAKDTHQPKWAPLFQATHQPKWAPLCPSSLTLGVTPSSSPLSWWWEAVLRAEWVSWRMTSPVWGSSVPSSSSPWAFFSALHCVREGVPTVAPPLARGTKPQILHSLVLPCIRSLTYT